VRLAAWRARAFSVAAVHRRAPRLFCAARALFSIRLRNPIRCRPITLTLNKLQADFSRIDRCLN